MPDKDVTKHRLFFWGMFVLVLCLIFVGWWKVNLSNWGLGNVSLFEKDTGDQVMGSLEDISGEASQQLNQLEESMAEEFDQIKGQDVPAEVIDAMIEEINNQNNYGQEESGS